MAWRLRLAPEKTNIDFFRYQWLTFGGSVALMILAFASPCAHGAVHAGWP